MILIVEEGGRDHLVDELLFIGGERTVVATMTCGLEVTLPDESHMEERTTWHENPCPVCALGTHREDPS